MPTIQLTLLKVAAELLQRIYASAIHLLAKSYMGLQTMGDDILEWHIPNLPYSLPYMISGDDLEVLRVFHQSQKKPSKWEE
ncbi:MAG: toxin ParE1/3/4 [Granulosicoccus sp.]|jgi:toxin ParE1/3/4